MQKISAKFPLPKWLVQPVHMFKVLGHDMQRCDLFKHATAMAYVTIFSMVPSLAATFAVISLFKPFLGQDSAVLMKVKSYILQNLATGSGEQVLAYLENFLANLDLKKIGLTGFAGLLFSLVLLLKQIEVALNRIWMVTKPRHIVRRFINFWTFLTLGTLFIGLAIGILSGFDAARLNPFKNVDIQGGRSMLASLTPLLTTFAIFTMLYKFVPNCLVKLKYAIMGALPAALLFNIAGGSYTWFASNFTNYRAVYGALAAVPLFLTWLYILWLITLFGALLAWRFEQGFELDDELDQENAFLPPEEKMRNHQLQAWMPYVVLLAIYEWFSRGEGEGLTGHDMATKLCIPPPWMADGLEYLLKLKLIVASKNIQAEDTTDPLATAYYPAVPAEKLSAQDALTKIYALALEWTHKEWNHEWHCDFRPLLREALEHSLKAQPNVTIAQILAKLT